MKDFVVFIKDNTGVIRPVLLCDAKTKDDAKDRAKKYGTIVGIVDNPNIANLVGINGKRVG